MWVSALPVLLLCNGCMSPIATAVSENQVTTLDSLIKRGADVNQSAWYGAPLHLAAMHGANDSARVLLSHGARVDSEFTVGRQTPLHFAAERGNDELVALLIRHGADVNARNVATGGLMEQAGQADRALQRRNPESALPSPEDPSTSIHGIP